MSATTLTNFYRCTIESIHTKYHSVVWAPAQDHKELQKVMNVAQSITQTNLPFIDSVYTSFCLGKAASIIKDPMHPGHALFHLLPSGKRYKSLKSRTNRLKNNVFPVAVRLLNDLPCIKLIFLYNLAMTVTLHSALSPFLLPNVLYEWYVVCLYSAQETILFNTSQ